MSEFTFFELVETAKVFLDWRDQRRWQEPCRKKSAMALAELAGVDSQMVEKYKAAMQRPGSTLDDPDILCRSWFARGDDAHPDPAPGEELPPDKRALTVEEAREGLLAAIRKVEKKRGERLFPICRQGDEGAPEEDPDCRRCWDAGAYEPFVRAMIRAALDGTRRRVDEKRGRAGGSRRQTASDIRRQAESLYSRVVTTADGERFSFDWRDWEGAEDTFRRMMAAHPFLLLTGEGGMGKTVFLRHAEGMSVFIGRKRVAPTLVRLSEPDARSRLEGIRPPALLLLDGYNEIPLEEESRAEETEGLCRAIRALTRQENVWLLVSDRSASDAVAADLEDRAALHSFATARLEPLTQEQVRREVGEEHPLAPSLLKLLRVPLYLQTYLRLKKKDDPSLNSKYGILDAFCRELAESRWEENHSDRELVVLTALLPWLAYGMVLADNAMGMGEGDLRRLVQTFARRMKNRDYARRLFDAVLPGSARRTLRASLAAAEWGEEELTECLLRTRLLQVERGRFSFEHQNWRDYFAVRHVLLHYRMLEREADWQEEWSCSVRMFDEYLMELLESALFAMPVPGEGDSVARAYEACLPMELARRDILAPGAQELCALFYFVGYDLWRRGLARQEFKQYIFDLCSLFAPRMGEKTGQKWGIAPHMLTKQAEFYRREGAYALCHRAAETALSLETGYPAARHQMAKANLLYAKYILEQGAVSADPNVHIHLPGVPIDPEGYAAALVAGCMELLEGCREAWYLPSCNLLGMLYSTPHPVLAPYIWADPVRAFGFFYDVTTRGAGSRWPESDQYACRQCAMLLVEGKVHITGRATPGVGHIDTASEVKPGPARAGGGLSETDQRWAIYFLRNLNRSRDPYVRYLKGCIFLCRGKYDRAVQLFLESCAPRPQTMALTRLYLLCREEPERTAALLRPEQRKELEQNLAQELERLARPGNWEADQYHPIHTLNMARELLEDHGVSPEDLNR